MKRPNRTRKRKLRVRKCSKCGKYPPVDYLIFGEPPTFYLFVKCETCGKDVSLMTEKTPNLFFVACKAVREWNKLNKR